MRNAYPTRSSQRGGTPRPPNWLQQLLTLTALLLATVPTWAQTYRTLPIASGFNQDVVAERSAPNANPATTANVNFSGTNFPLVLAEQGFNGLSTGMPTSRTLTSAVTAGLPYEFAAYSTTSSPYHNSNALRLSNTGTGTNSGTLTLTTPVAVGTLYVLAGAGDGDAQLIATLLFSDGTTQTVSGLTVSDFASSLATDQAATVAWVRRDFNNAHVTPYLRQIALAVDAGNRAKLLSSVAFTKSPSSAGNSVANILALSARITTPPTLASLSPSSGAVGTPVTLTGSNFTAGSTVRFSGTAATAVTFNSATSLTATVPAGATTGNVTVTTPDGTSSGVNFTVTVPSPTITSFSPASGPIGQSVTITGTGFNTTANQNIVFFGATRATVTAASPTSLTVTVPLGATYQYISVTNLATQRTAYSNKPFNVTLNGAIVFQPKQNLTISTGDDFLPIAIGDLDGDGKPELVTANLDRSNVSVLRNTSTAGTVSFAAKVDFPTSIAPWSLAIGDVNGDGKLDLVTVNYDNSVSVLINTSTMAGTIGFAAKVDMPVGRDPESIAIGDVDGDGKPDIVTTSTRDNLVSVLRNTSTAGAVSFAAKVDFSVGRYPTSVFIGDLDGDGKPELAVTSGYDNNVSVLRNTSPAAGTVNFATKLDFPTGDYPYGVVIGDANGDSKPDLTIVNAGGSVSVLRNTNTVAGTISFAPTVDFITGKESVSLDMDDLDGDGKPDLALANYGSNDVTILRNTSTTAGAVSFVTTASFATDNYPWSVAIGDLDGDGKPDLATANDRSGTLSVLRQQQAAPTLAAVTPNAGPAGSPITLTGTNLTGTTAITFAGTSNNVVTTGFTVNAAGTSITNVVVPAGATSGNVTVTTPGGTSNGISFTVCTVTQRAGYTFVGNANGRAYYRSINSQTGSQAYAQARAAGANLVTINDPAENVYVQNLAFGADLWLGLNDLAVEGTFRWQDGSTTSYLNWAGGEPNNAGNEDYVVIKPNGTWNDTRDDHYGVAAYGLLELPICTAPPSISGLSPASGPIGRLVTVTGTDFTGVSSVTLNGTVVSAFTLVNSTTITFVVPAGATSGPVTVTTLNGSAQSVDSFTVVVVVVTPAPTLTSLNPTSGPVGTPVVLTGTNFTPGSTVRFNGTAATAVTFNSATSLTATVPAGATTGLVTVTTPGGTSSGVNFIVTVPVPDLVVSTGTPAAPVAIAAGTYRNVTLTGSGNALLGGAVVINGTLQVQAGATLSTNCQLLTGSGSFELQAGATLRICDAAGISTTGATGAVQLSGSRSFSPEASYVYNGTVAQVNGPGLPGTVARLTLANAAGLTLTQSLTVSTALTTSVGTLAAGTGRLTLAPTATISESETSYVLGTVATTRPLAPGGSEAFGGLGLTLRPASGSVAPGSTLVVRTTGTALTGAGTSQSILRFFDIRPTVDQGLDVAMDFAYFLHELNGIAPNSLRLFKSETGMAPWVPQVGTTAGVGQLTKTGITDFSVWTLGDTANPLPVELTEFTATAAGPRTVRLAWATASERNSQAFVVERSADGRAFAAIGTVAAAGSSSSARRYGHEDRQAPRTRQTQDLLYYRLRQVDADGTVAYSPVRTVTLTGAAGPQELTLAPNPTTGAATLRGAAPGAAVTVLDALGRPVLTATADAEGQARLQLPAGTPTGVYVVRCGTQARHLVVQH